MDFEVEYPQFPQPQTNITPKGYYPKLPYNDLMRIYDELTALGLYVLPKQRDNKLPLWKYWKKGEGQEVCTRDKAARDQKDDRVSGWCVVTGEKSDRLLVLDFDPAEILSYGVDPVQVYEQVQAMSLNRFILGTPANGVHMIYRVPEDWEPLTNAAPPVRGVDARGEGGQVVSLGGWNRYDNSDSDPYADKKGVPDGHTGSYTKLDYGDYSQIPYMSRKLYDWILSGKETRKKKPTTNHIEGENYAQTEQGSARISAHFNQPESEQERLVLECLSFVLDNWSSEQAYEDWYQMWMSAHHGSGGSAVVRDYILAHPLIYWRDGDEGRSHFRRAWDTHQQRDSGFSVASLFYLARKSGWLSKTGYEIPDRLTERINVRYITDWVSKQEQLDEILLLISQTGSGKTYNIKYLYDRLEQPKTVIFVPSIKLATELAMTLKNVHSLPATLYIDQKTGRSIDVGEMIEAKILVTTLQTFSTKLRPAGVKMSDYGLVYIEESDQLLAQFARGGGGIYGSHVADREARAGYATIREAFAESKYVWCVDATMSKVSYYVAEALRGSRSVKVIRNTHIEPKAHVTFLTDKGQAYQQVLKALEAKKRVVVAADTAQVAEELVQTMKAIGALDNKKSLLITRHTERNREVHQFMEDVNKHAPQYDLIAYNSVMASGVSITSIAPDVLVQVCTYLTPRTNLQILNRYRNQKQVYCYFRTGENLYANRAEDVLLEAEQRAWTESGIVNIPLATRNSDAELRSKIAAISVADSEQQSRAPKDFYISLLKGDGRTVSNGSSEPVAKVLKHTLDGVRKVKAAMKQKIASTWHEVPPIDKDRPAQPEMTDLEVAQGEVHAEIERALRGNIPKDQEPKHIYEVVKEFSDYGFVLSAFVEQDIALKRAEEYLADRGKALTALANNITLIKTLSTVHHIYHALDDEVTTEKVSERAADFMKSLRENRQEYDAVILRKTQKFDVIDKKYSTDEEKAMVFVKVILSRIGLKQRSSRADRKGGEANYIYRIVNSEKALDFLRWRNANKQDFKPEINFTTAPIEKIISSREDAAGLFRQMTQEQREQVMNLLGDGTHTDFPTAVMYVTTNSGQGW